MNNNDSCVIRIGNVLSNFFFLRNRSRREVKFSLFVTTTDKNFHMQLIRNACNICREVNSEN